MARSSNFFGMKLSFAFWVNGDIRDMPERKQTSITATLEVTGELTFDQVATKGRFGAAG